MEERRGEAAKWRHKKEVVSVTGEQAWNHGEDRRVGGRGEGQGRDRR